MLVVTTVASPPPAHAQEAHEAFARIAVSARAVIGVASGDLDDYWRPNPGAELTFGTPFYVGSVELGVQVRRFSANGPEQPHFNSLFPFLGWGVASALPLDAEWYVGARVGSYAMWFADTDVNSAEQELGIGIHSRLTYSLGAKWAVDVSGRYTLIYTHERIRLFDLAIGMSWSTGMPGWLRGFLE